jgi:hypothetical protein
MNCRSGERVCGGAGSQMEQDQAIGEQDQAIGEQERGVIVVGCGGH